LDYGEGKSLLLWWILSYLSLYIVNDTCRYRYNNFLCIEFFIWFCVASLIIIVKRRYGNAAVKNVMFIFDLLLSGWLIARLFNALNLSCQVDVFTVYFLVGQFMYVVSKWILHELPWFSFTVQQGLLCLRCSFNALIVHDIYFRHFSIYLKVAFLWYTAFGDW
jgi:hypothetical protein